MSPEQEDLKELVLFPLNISLAVARGIGRLIVDTADSLRGRIDEPNRDL